MQKEKEKEIHPTRHVLYLTLFNNPKGLPEHVLLKDSFFGKLPFKARTYQTINSCYVPMLSAKLWVTNLPLTPKISQ